MVGGYDFLLLSRHISQSERPGWRLSPSRRISMRDDYGFTLEPRTQDTSCFGPAEFADPSTPREFSITIAPPTHSLLRIQMWLRVCTLSQEALSSRSLSAGLSRQATQVALLLSSSFMKPHGFWLLMLAFKPTNTADRHRHDPTLCSCYTSDPHRPG